MNPSVPALREAAARTAILVLGMHRSGTSALAGAVHVLGAGSPRTLMPGDATNPRGFWESNAIVPIHEELLAAMGSSWDDWREANLAWLEGPAGAEFAARLAAAVAEEFDDAPLFVLKDPRICRLLPFWVQILRRLQLNVVVFHIVRNPLEVAASLERRDRFIVEKSCLLWLRHELDAEANSRSLPRAFLEYEHFLQDPASALEAAAQATNIIWPRSAEAWPRLAEFLTPELHRERASVTDLAAAPRVVDWAKDAFEQFRVLARDFTNPEALSGLERIRIEFQRSCHAFGPVFVQERRDAADDRLAATRRELEREQAHGQELRDNVDRQQEQLHTAAAEGERQALEARWREEQGQIEASANELRAALADAESQRISLQLQLAEHRRQLAEARIERLTAARDAATARQTLRDRERDIADLDRQWSEAKARISVVERALSEAQARSAASRPESHGARAEVRNEDLGLPEGHSLREQRRTIAADFDPDFYLSRNEDVRRAGVDPIEHFLHHGWLEGRDPAAGFSTTGYLQTNPDVRRSGINPFYHFIKTGRGEGRQPNDFTSTVAAPTPPPSDEDERTRAETRQVLESHFDREFYLASHPDVAAAGIDPLDHYIEAGWREGRDPATTFATSHYLEANPDVADARINPFYHFLVAGKTEGRQGIHHAGWQLRMLESVASTAGPLGDALSVPLTFESPLSADALLAAVTRAGGGAQRTLLVSVSHDDYKKSVGGVQLCLNLEERLAVQAGCTYLNVHPVHPLLSLSAATTPGALGLSVTCNGIHCGTASASVVIEALARLRPTFESCDLVVHALLGHSPEVLTELYRRIAPQRCLWWVHDFFALCPNHTLLRNGVKFCAAPPLNSGACSICAYGDERTSHASRLRSLFAAVPFTLVAPSAFAAEFIDTHAEQGLKTSLMQPHCTIEPTPGAAESVAEPAAVIRVAFLGHATVHKGWRTFVRLVDAMGHDASCSFHHLGAGKRLHRGTHFTRVSVIADGPAAMVEALVQQRIDVVILWSIWPETFSFVAHEALAANAMIVTCEDSGNIARVAREHGGAVFRDEEALLRAFTDGTLQQLVRRHRSAPRGGGHLKFSGMSLSVLGHELATTA